MLVQKAAWGLVLVAALAMPLAPHWQAMPAFAALRLPALAPLQPALIPNKALQEPPLRSRIRLQRPFGRARLLRLQRSPTISMLLRLSATALNDVADQALSQTEPYISPLTSESSLNSKSVNVRPHQNQAKLAQASVPAASRPSIESGSDHNSISAACTGKSNPAPISSCCTRLASLSRRVWRLARTAVRWPGIGAQALVESHTGRELPGSEPAPGLRLRSSTRVASPVNIGSGIVSARRLRRVG